MSGVPELSLLCDPWLQSPTPNSVKVVWCTEFMGIDHIVWYGDSLDLSSQATTSELTRLREDRYSCLSSDTRYPLPQTIPQHRHVWRHQATVTGLEPGCRYSYRVCSIHENGQQVHSDVFTLTATPVPGTPLKILLTSDHQLKPMVAANLAKVMEQMGRIDAIFYAGDLVNVPDRASEWFDDGRSGAWFPCLQGRAQAELASEQGMQVFRGGALLQHAPLFLAFGNHEVMGRWHTTTDLHEQFRDAIPRWVAEQQYQAQVSRINPTNDPQIQAQWIQDHSFNTTTVDQLFGDGTLLQAGQHYYAASFGDVYLIVLFLANVWRSPVQTTTSRGKYQERLADMADPDRWGYGQHIFASIAAGSEQHQWLTEQLDSDAFRQATYKVVMFHHPPHGLGGNIVPAFTDPVQVFERDAQGQVQGIRYEYPQVQDYLVGDVLPLLEAAGVQLVYYGHSHLWNRFVGSQGIHYLESSNVGNSYGAHVGDAVRSVPTNFAEDYAATGNPNGLAPITPTLAPLLDGAGQPLPYVASNEITVFSILDTGTGTVSSYRFDTRFPDEPVIKFDEFMLGIKMLQD